MKNTKNDNSEQYKEVKELIAKVNQEKVVLEDLIRKEIKANEDAQKALEEREKKEHRRCDGGQARPAAFDDASRALHRNDDRAVARARRDYGAQRARDQSPRAAGDRVVDMSYDTSLAGQADQAAAAVEESHQEEGHHRRDGSLGRQCRYLKLHPGVIDGRHLDKLGRPAVSPPPQHN